MSRKPLGSAEKEVLRRLYLNGAVWSVGDRALWDSRHWTLALLGSLTVKGLVDEEVPNLSYKLSAAGLDLLVKEGITFPTPSPMQGRQPVHFPRQGHHFSASVLRRP